MRHSKPSICVAKRGEAIGESASVIVPKPFGGAVGLVSVLEHVACPCREPHLVFRVLPVMLGNEGNYVSPGLSAVAALLSPMQQGQLSDRIQPSPGNKTES